MARDKLSAFLMGNKTKLAESIVSEYKKTAAADATAKAVMDGKTSAPAEETPESKEAEKIRNKKASGKVEGGEIDAFKEEVSDEEAEEIQELSKATLGSYVKKATDDQRFRYHKAGQLGAESSADANKGDSKESIKKNNAAAVQLIKGSKRHNGIERAVSKLTKEEVENLEELSKATLKSYVGKARADHFKHRDKVDYDGDRGEGMSDKDFSDNSRKLNNRAIGIATAAEKHNSKAFLGIGKIKHQYASKDLKKVYKEEVENLEEAHHIVYGENKVHGIHSSLTVAKKQADKLETKTGRVHVVHTADKQGPGHYVSKKIHYQTDSGWSSDSHDSHFHVKEDDELEGDRIEELSKEALKVYKDKAEDNRSRHMEKKRDHLEKDSAYDNERAEKHGNVAAKRTDGIRLATKKLKEETVVQHDVVGTKNLSEALINRGIKPEQNEIREKFKALRDDLKKSTDYHVMLEGNGEKSKITVKSSLGYATFEYDGEKIVETKSSGVVNKTLIQEKLEVVNKVDLIQE